MVAVRRVAVVAAASSIVATLAACSSTGDSSGATRPPAPSGTVATTPLTGSSAGSGAGPSGAATSGRTPGRPAGTRRPSGPAGPLTEHRGPRPPRRTRPPGGSRARPRTRPTCCESVPGSGRADCADPGSNPTFRANGVAVGNFVQMRKSFAKQYGHTEVPELDAYVVPAHAKRLRRVSASVVPLSGGSTRRVSSTSVQQGDAASYFALQLPVEKPGRYRLTFVSGPDSGCFVVSFPAPLTGRAARRF